MLSLTLGTLMPFHSKITPEQKQQMFQWASEGVQMAEIVRRLDGAISKQRVHQLCTKAKISSMAIRKEKNEKEQHTKMSAKWGEQWKDKEWRASSLFLAMKDKFKNKQQAAKYGKHEWNLVFNDLEWPLVCPILGLELDYFCSVRTENSVSFDRIDNEKGYVKGNVVVMSWRANRIKNDGTAEEHQKIADFLTIFPSTSCKSSSSCGTIVL
jgi:hypothetical protein